MTVTYAQRAPDEPLAWRVMIVTDATGTTEHQSGPHPTPQGAVQALAAAQARQMPGPTLGDALAIERAL